jgi:predicted phosphodiesterase
MHGNHVARHALGAVLADVKAINPDEVVFLGDVLDCGGFLAQHHILGYVQETKESSYAQDVKAGNDILDKFIQAAPNATMHYIEGNHERRVETWCVTTTLRHQEDAEFLRNLVGIETVLQLDKRNISYYRMSERYNNLPIDGCIQLGQCLYTHGWSTSKAAATAHAKIAGMSVIYGHTHRSQSDVLRTVAGGVFGAYSPGCLSQLQRYYEHGVPNDHSHGYGVQVVAKSGKFLYNNVPIVDGESLFLGAFNHLNRDSQ